MQYRGGKAKIAKQLTNAIDAICPLEGVTVFEPFLGAANLAPHWVRHGVRRLFAGDLNAPLVRMWNEMLEGWDPPTNITEEEYASLRAARDSTPRGVFASYACSFGGKKWGGFARGPWVDPARERRRALEKCMALRLLNAGPIACQDYRDWGPPATVVYADPPYAGTPGYGGAFDTARFWAWCASMALSSRVFVSEQSLPAVAHSVVWSGARADNLASGRNSSRRIAVARTEYLIEVLSATGKG